MKQYLMNILIALDQVLTAIFGGYPDETMSSYLYRLEKQDKPAGALRAWVDTGFLVLFDERDHCHDSYLAERARVQLPPELR